MLEKSKKKGKKYKVIFANIGPKVEKDEDGQEYIIDQNGNKRFVFTNDDGIQFVNWMEDE